MHMHGLQSGSGGQEIDGIGDGDFADVFGLEIEEFDSLRDLLTEGGIVQFAGDQLAAGYLA